jgi:hypothetical protein
MMMGSYGGGFDTRYGYTLTLVGDKRVFLPHPIEHPILMRMLTEQDQGKTLREIEDGLNADQVPIASGKGRWHYSTIQKMIFSERRRAAYIEGLSTLSAEAESA